MHVNCENSIKYLKKKKIIIIKRYNILTFTFNSWIPRIEFNHYFLSSASGLGPEV